VCDQVYGVFDSSKAERFALHPFVTADRVTGLYTDEGVPAHVVADWGGGRGAGPPGGGCPLESASRPTPIRSPCRSPVAAERAGRPKGGCPVTAHRTVAAVDLVLRRAAGSPPWASTGRRLELELGHRFTHEPKVVDGILALGPADAVGRRAHGLAALEAGPAPIASVGVDTWGVDYALLRRTDGELADGDRVGGELVDEPTCYRDPRQVEAIGDRAARDRRGRALPVGGRAADPDQHDLRAAGRRAAPA